MMEALLIAVAAWFLLKRKTPTGTPAEDNMIGGYLWLDGEWKLGAYWGPYTPADAQAKLDEITPLYAAINNLHPHNLPDGSDERWILRSYHDVTDYTRMPQTVDAPAPEG